MNHKNEYRVDLPSGDFDTIRAHYFTINGSGDVTFFIASTKNGSNKLPIAAIASGEWCKIREVWNKEESNTRTGKTIKDVPLIGVRELPYSKRLRNGTSYK